MTQQQPVPASLRLGALLRPHLCAFTGAAAAMLLHALATGLYAYLVGPLMAYIFSGGTDGYQPFLQHLPGLTPDTLDTTHLAWLLPLMLILIAFIKAGAHITHVTLTGIIGQRVARNLRQSLFKAIIDAHRCNAHPISRGDTVARLGGDVDILQAGSIDAIATALRDGATVAALLALALALDPTLALLAFVALPLAVWPIRRFGKKLHRSSQHGQEALGAMATDLIDTLANRDHLRAHPIRQAELRRFANTVQDIYTARIRASFLRATNHGVMELFGVSAIALTLWLAIYRINSGHMQAHELISFFAATLMLYEPLKGLARAHTATQEARASAQRLAPLLNTLPQPSGSLLPPPLQVEVEARGLTFTHGDTPLFTNLSFTLGRGHTLLICGPSGVGKTTLLRIIAGLIPPQRGEVYWDQLPYTLLDNPALASRIGYLDQDAALLGRSFRDNLDPCHRHTEEELLAALERCGARAFVEEHGGLDGYICDAAANLSGGQRRRLALARAWLPEPDLLLLDEPTDAVDPDTEAHILDALAARNSHTTAILVVHRPEIAPWADQVLRLSPPTATQPPTP